MECGNEPLAQNLTLNLGCSNGSDLSGTQYFGGNRRDPNPWNTLFAKDFALELGCPNTRGFDGTQYLRA